MAAMVTEFDYSYDGSDESSENELLDRSLSVWKGGCLENENFLPIPLDLHTAASIGQYDCVHTLIKRGDVALNEKNKGGWTALMYASYIGHENIVTLLLEARVSVNVKSSKGQTPLMLAASCGNEGVAYFLLQADADLEARDKQGWTALFHATSSGHQNMVKFLLDNEANTEAAEPSREFTPFLEAAAAGHEIIVQYFLQHGVDLNVKSSSGDTARSLAMMAGHTKIVTLIDNYAVMGESSSSDEGGQVPRGQGHHASRSRRDTGSLSMIGPNIREGPEALAQLFGQGKQGSSSQPQQAEPRGTEQEPNVCVPKGYMTFPAGSSGAATTDEISFRDVTSPINPDDYTVLGPTLSETDTEKDGTAFSKTGALTIKSSSGASGGLVAALGLKNSSDSGNDDESSDIDLHTMGQRANDTVDQHDSAKQWPHTMGQRASDTVDQHDSVKQWPHTMSQRASDTVDQQDSVKQWQQNHFGDSTETKTFAPETHNSGPGLCQEIMCQDTEPSGGKQSSKESGLERTPEDLGTLLRQLGLSKYQSTFEEQDVDLQVFLSLTDNDLKEVGIKLFGPRRKMTNAIARWHSNARHKSSGLEQTYADKMEAEMQEMAIQLHKAYDQMEVLNQQVLQERELRSVTEGWLMDDRVSWQEVAGLAADSHATGCNMTSLLDTIRQFEHEVAVRLGTLPAPATAHGGGSDGLAAALKEGLSLDENPQPVLAIRAQSTETIVECLEKYHSELNGAAFRVVLNADKILTRTEHAGAMGAITS